MNRRSLLLAAPALALAGGARAQSFPARPIRIIVTIGAGSAADILTRALADELGRRLGQSVVVENRPGAGGNIAGEVVRRADPDGRTLLMATVSTHGINPALYRAMPFDPVADFAPITLAATSPNVLVVHPDSPYRSVADIVAAARARPGELTYSSGGSGTSQHLGGAVLEQMTGVRLTHVPFRSAPESINAVLGQQTTMTFASVPAALGMAQGGRLRPIALSGLRPMASWPEVKPLAELGLPGFDVTAWFGLVGPARTPAAVVEQINAATRAALEVPAVRERLAGQGMQVLEGGPAEFGAFIRSEIARWAPIVRASGATAD
ncbi:Bug family tripartite tricarboxylate transporter substrate binding protein [Falsiroseomonas stagni]|uniref:Tripartite-type tricarboxylate transporter, receptor component TctC n=1 Tax=Falsiroseomonas stagni DSM 19981 TaxID=1123062 RepID=A0A1I4E1V2_9PROT|nr:tripartite tricarboxylate transporter substrate binding protein [Falsiroseomonas stagni]SFK99149.1 Tripartite-type tricarboxylate transporter, receptor component TctC [Falsiroseomonas stagni DSM 19981]